VIDMPIEIRELVIRATVDPGKTPGAAAASTPAAAASRRTPPGVEDDVVQTCVREVMRILESKRER
jgi:hypothetical protein